MDGHRRQVVYFTSSFLPPSETFMVEQARHLATYEPKFIAARKHESKAARQHPVQVDFLCASVRRHRASVGLRLFRWVDPVFKELTRNASILHAQFGRNGYVAWPVARALGLPFVTTFHGFDATFAGNPVYAGGFNQRLFFLRGRRQMAEARLNCIAVSNYVRSRLIELGFAEQKIFRRYIGIDTALFIPQPEVERVKGRVVCVSRFVEIKGHRFIIEAMSRLTRSGIPIELVMVGQGPLRDEIERAARKELARVIVLHDQSQSEIAQLLRTAQLCVTGSYRTPTGQAEALGLSNLEAQAVGTPVVAFDSGGVGEAVSQGKSGYLVPEKDVAAMSTMAATLLAEPERWASFSGAAIDFVRANFDIQKCTRLLEQTYDDIVHDHDRDKRVSVDRQRRDEPAFS